MAETTDGNSPHCSACGKPVSDTDVRCPACGVPRAESLRCPHCRAIADIEPSPTLRFACSICGGPRIPLDDSSIVRSNAELEALQRAGRAHTTGWVWHVSAAVMGGFGLLGIVVLSFVVGVVHPGTLATLVATAVAAVPMVAAAIAFRSGKARAKEASVAVDLAWQMVVAELCQARGGEIDAAAIAKTMRLDLVAADHLLAAMSAKNLLSGSVTPEGMLRYRLLSDPRNLPRLP